MAARENAKLIVVAVGCVILGLTAPTAARSIEAAVYANNSDKVDGKHAVTSAASIKQRKGKLVATSRKTGRLPSNIIAKAPNSNRLNGYSHRALRSMPMLVQGAGLGGSATAFYGGVSLSSTSAGEMRFGFVVPPDHKAGSPVYADIVYGESSDVACSWYVSTSGLEGPDDGEIYNGAWFVKGHDYEGRIKVRAGDSRAFKRTFRWASDSSRPGQFIQFALERLGANAADTCSTVYVYGVQIRY